MNHFRRTLPGPALLGTSHFPSPHAGCWQGPAGMTLTQCQAGSELMVHLPSTLRMAISCSLAFVSQNSLRSQERSSLITYKCS